MPETATGSSRRTGSAERWMFADRSLGRLVSFASGLAIATAAVVMVLRWPHPFMLEWMEGGILDHVRIVLRGESLYREPSIEFTPFLYTPLYYALTAPLAAAFGASLQVGRAVSIGATLACGWIVHSIVRRETEDGSAALLAAGLFAATYGVVGGWYDIARPDSLAAALVLAGVWLARFGRSAVQAAASGVLFFLAFFTKQTSLVLCVPAALFLLVRKPRHGLWMLASLAVAVAVAHASMQAVSDGWFAWYVFAMPAEHHLHWPKWRSLLVDHLWTPVGPMLLATLWVGVFAARQRPQWLIHPALFAVAAVTGWMGVLHDGGGVNVFIPAYGFLAISAAIAVSWSLQQAKARPEISVFVRVVMLLQFALLAYRPWQYVPDEKDRTAGERMMATLVGRAGSTWMPGAGFYLGRFDDEIVQAHAMALVDVFKTRRRDVKQKLLSELVRTVKRRQFDVIVFGIELDLMPPQFRRQLRRTYVLDQNMFAKEGDHMVPPTGYTSRPQRLYVAKKNRRR